MIERAKAGSYWLDSDGDLWLKTESGADAMDQMVMSVKVAL